MSSLPPTTDILILGSGASGLTTALTALLSSSSPSRRPSVLLLDACPESWAGGNSYFTAGAYRTVHGGLDDMVGLVGNVRVDDGVEAVAAAAAATAATAAEPGAPTEDDDANDEMVPASQIDLAPYTAEEFLGDMRRVTGGRCDGALAGEVVGGSWEAVRWLGETGRVAWQLSFRRQAYVVRGRVKFWGGLALTVKGGGKGLVRGLRGRVEGEGGRVEWGWRGVGLVREGGRVVGVRVVRSEEGGEEVVVRAKAVVMCAGGFEASREMRRRWMGERWEKAHVRGTPYNDGSMLEVAVRDVGAERVGDWEGCHAVAWDADAPLDRGDREIGNEFTKSGYPLGIMVDVRGRRFVDEGVDLRNYTYAKFGRAILEQEGGVCWQVWDGKGVGWLRGEEYRDERVRKVVGGTVEELAEGMKRGGLVEKEGFLRTVREFNEAVYRAEGERRRQGEEKKWDPAVRDGLSTQSREGGLALPKSNWALAIDQAPFVAVKVGSGITFTFGGLRINPQNAAVIEGETGKEVPGLFCAGEMVGGLFYGNYPGGSGLTSGAVFGRKAGMAAAEWARQVAREESGTQAKL